uniref:Cell growth regulator with RING finger domain protein 1 n=1 Tax=Cacopsylla melanoneura TaxID=428564 RepID=A0A8D8V2A5_9HEMI
MVLTLTAMFVVTVAEFSSFLSILAVLICFFAMFLLIVSLRIVFRNMTVFWLHGEEIMFGSSVHTVHQNIPQMKMMKVHIPFTFKLQETSRSSFSDIQCTVSSQVPYTLQVLWGVSIRELHLFLWRPWSSFDLALQNDSIPVPLYQQKGICIKESCHGEKSIMLNMPEEKLKLGRPPRLCYPLVVILSRRDPCNLHPNEPVALINVVHIKDAVCTLPTNILAQYLKQANGQLSSLKQLYLATGNPSPSSYEDANETARLEASPGAEAQLCVVCQTSPLSRALLPCRHTCICATCFSKLAQCPMCRSQIKSYFCVRAEDYLSGPLSEGSAATLKSVPGGSASPGRSWLRLRHRITNLIRSAEQ